MPPERPTGRAPERAWLTYADRHYMPLVEVLVDGLARFSRHPVVVYGLDTEVPFSAPGLIKRTLACPDGELYAAKLRVLLDADLPGGVFLDADHVPTAAVDTLFDAVDEVGDHPLAPRHPRDLVPLQGELMAALGVERPTMPYVHTCCFAFTARCRPFFAECERILRQLAAPGGERVPDEPAFNVLLWKRGARRCLDPSNIPFEFFDCYLDGGCGDDPRFRELFGAGAHRFLTFHYAKDPVTARRMLDRLTAPAAAGDAAPG